MGVFVNYQGVLVYELIYNFRFFRLASDDVTLSSEVVLLRLSYFLVLQSLKMWRELWRIEEIMFAFQTILCLDKDIDNVGCDIVTLVHVLHGCRPAITQ